MAGGAFAAAAAFGAAGAAFVATGIAEGDARSALYFFQHAGQRQATESVPSLCLKRVSRHPSRGLASVVVLPMSGGEA